jgi:two-component system NtrC family sensor kinase
VRLRTRLMLVMAMATVGPIAVLGVGTIQVSADLMTDAVTDSQARTADELASHVDLWLTLELQALSQQARAFRLDQLRDSDLVSFQRLIFQQSADANIVSIIGATGQDLAPSLYLNKPRVGRLSKKEAVSPERFSAFRAGLPLKRLAKAGKSSTRLVVGRPYIPPGREGPVLPLVVPTSSDVGLFLAVELSMDTVTNRFGNRTDNGVEVALIDGTGAAFIHHGGDLIEADRFRAFVGGTACSDVRYRSASGEGVVAACAPVHGTGWLAVVAEPMSAITSAGDEIRNRTLYIAGIAGLIAILLGVGLSRTIAQQVGRLKDAAFEVAEGHLGLRVSPDGPSEVRELALAFNFMSTRLAKNQSEIEQNREEISAFTRELQRQLDEQRLELTDAHRMLVQSARLAAVGEMGAGLAHELNNPLAGILGMVQILQAKGGEAGAMLGEVEAQAQRCRQIVQQLLRVSQAGDSPVPVDRRDWIVVDLTVVVEEVITLVTGPFREGGVEILIDTAARLPVRCDREAVGTAVAQLLTSMRAACGRGGQLQVVTHLNQDEVILQFIAKGPQLDLNRDDWKAMGMGFWFARQVISDHGGRMEEPAGFNAQNEAMWTIALPGV